MTTTTQNKLGKCTNKTPEGLAAAGLANMMQWLQSGEITGMEYAAASAIIVAQESAKAAKAEAEAAAAKAASSKPRQSKRVVKLNQSGGLYVTDPAFVCWSKAKGKNYQGGMNLDIGVARGLFGNDSLLGEIRAFLAGLDK